MKQKTTSKPCTFVERAHTHTLTLMNKSQNPFKFLIYTLQICGCVCCLNQQFSTVNKNRINVCVCMCVRLSLSLWFVRSFSRLIIFPFSQLFANQLIGKSSFFALRCVMKCNVFIKRPAFVHQQKKKKHCVLFLSHYRYECVCMCILA